MQAVHEVQNTAAGQQAIAAGLLSPASYGEGKTAGLETASARPQAQWAVWRCIAAVGTFCGGAASVVVLVGLGNVFFFHRAFYDGIDSALVSGGGVLLGSLIVRSLRDVS